MTVSRRQQNRIEREQRILDAALKVFSQQGFAGTKMDAIAIEAGLSKPTLYQYFDSKEQLFTAMMQARRDDMLVAFDTDTANAHGARSSSEMVRQLYEFAWRYADTVLRPELLSLARLIIGEAQRFPEVGRAYQQSGPDRVLDGIIAYLEQQRAAGWLQFTEADLAANDLWGLILSAPRNQALYLPDTPPDRATVSRSIVNGLQVFLKAYSSNRDKDLRSLARLVTADNKAAFNDKLL